jgi:hypothetical protein
MKKLSPPVADGLSDGRDLEVRSKLEDIRSASCSASSRFDKNQPIANDAEQYYAKFLRLKRDAHETPDLAAVMKAAVALSLPTGRAGL